MAPREPPKTATKVQRFKNANETPEEKASPKEIKKTLLTKKNIEKTTLKLNNKIQTRQRTHTVPIVSTPKSKGNKSIPLPIDALKSVKKGLWKRRPKPAHSGVPVPEKMKKLIEKKWKDSEFPL